MNDKIIITDNISIKISPVKLVLEPYYEVNYRSELEAETYAKPKPNSFDIEAWINGVLYFRSFGGEWLVHPIPSRNVFMKFIRRAEKQDIPLP